MWLARFPSEDDSIHLRDFPAVPEGWLDPALADRWETVRAARRTVTAALEIQRTAKVIGASLEAAPVVYVTPQMMALLETVAFEDVCITSCVWLSTSEPPQDAFRLADVPDVAVQFRMAEGDKCQRCWRILPDVGTHAHPGLCERCDAAL